jgi:hypothetical protein
MKDDLSKMKQKGTRVIIFLMIVALICMFVKCYNDSEEIKTHLGKTICKYTFCKQSGKSSTAFVKYYIDNKIYRTRAGGCPENSGGKINKYFNLKYSTIDPNKIEVDFSKEVMDKAEIEYLELNLKNWFELE